MRTTLLFFIFLVSSTYSKACNCFGHDSYCETISSSEEYLYQGFHVKGVKIKEVEHGMDFLVLEAYDKEFSEDVIRIWGDLGWLCRHYVSSFEDGDTLILNLLQIGEQPLVDVEQTGDFAISHCGIHFLYVKNNNVSGPIHSSENETISLEDFEDQLRSPYWGLISSLEQRVDQNQVKIFPNPFGSMLHISSTFPIDKVEIINTTGALVTRKNNIEDSFFTLQLDEWPSGAYIINLLGIKGESLNKKIVKI